VPHGYRRSPCRAAACFSCLEPSSRASDCRSTSWFTWTSPEQGWELPAFDRYDDEVDPVALADAVVLADHADRPALVLAGRFLS
jgi:hypothetical protein